MELWSVKRRNLIQQAIDEFQEDVAQVFANPRWRHYSDMSLKRYDQFEALRQAAQRLEKAYSDSVALAREAQNYCEAVARDFRQSASDLVSPSQFGNEILIFDREVEAKINLARKPDDVVAAFKEGTTYTTNKAQRYAWIRNMDKALRRIEEMTQSTEGPKLPPMIPATTCTAMLSTSYAVLPFVLPGTMLLPHLVQIGAVLPMYTVTARLHLGHEYVLAAMCSLLPLGRFN
jgi:hypothetical protein